MLRTYTVPLSENRTPPVQNTCAIVVPQQIGPNFCHPPDTTQACKVSRRLSMFVEEWSVFHLTTRQIFKARVSLIKRINYLLIICGKVLHYI